MNNKNVYIAKQKVVFSTPRKLAVVAELIRKKNIDYAINQLKICRKKASEYVLNVLQAAIANASNNFNEELENLYVSEVLVGKSYSLKRFMPRAKGRATKIFKKYSYLTIKLKKIQTEVGK